MAKDISGPASGIGFFGLLTIVFITLKLLHVIDWPWIFVLAPILLPITIGILFLIVACVLLLVGKLMARRQG